VTAPPTTARRARRDSPETRAVRVWGALAMIGVLAVAALLRLWALDRPDRLVFDELYYVRDAVSQLAHGFPTTWPDKDPAFGGALARAFTDQAASIAHPPLGKWLIGLGMLLLGVDGPGIDSGWGWRISVALAGVVTVGLTMRLGWLMSRSLWVACCAGLLLAIDGVHVVLSRVALLDGFLTLFVVLGAILIWRDQEAIGRRLRSSTPGSALGPILWRRPWLLAAGLAFGAAAAVKWSGLYPLAAFLLLITARDTILRRRTAERPWLGSLRQAAVTAAIALPAALLSYVASWTGWIVTSGGQDRVAGEAWWVSLWRWHANAFQWHSTLTADHPFRADPLGWPLALRPTSMYWSLTEPGPGCLWPGGCVSAISPLPDPLVTWGGVLALLVLLWVVARAIIRAARRRVGPAGEGWASLAEPPVWSAAFVLVGYLSGWLPWVLTFSRSAVFQFYAVVLTPFAALALALLLGSICSSNGRDAMAAGVRLRHEAGAVQGRRIAVAVYLLMAVVLAVLFFPVWSGMPVAEWFWRAHIWLPGWR